MDNFLDQQAIEPHMGEIKTRMQQPHVKLQSIDSCQNEIASVLIPIITKPVPTLILTQRAAHLSHHAGEVCFPGGRPEAGDRTLIDTALRESYEEIALPAHSVEICGLLNFYQTGTGFWVQPVVGLIDDASCIFPASNEVDSIFEVPLWYALNPQNYQEKEIKYRSYKRRYYSTYYNSYNIWGATAGMIISFYQQLTARK